MLIQNESNNKPTLFAKKRLNKCSYTSWYCRICLLLCHFQYNSKPFYCFSSLFAHIYDAFLLHKKVFFIVQNQLKCFKLNGTSPHCFLIQNSNSILYGTEKKGEMLNSVWHIVCVGGAKVIQSYLLVGSDLKMGSVAQWRKSSACGFQFRCRMFTFALLFH